jgi:hypothetical protein
MRHKKNISEQMAGTCMDACAGAGSVAGRYRSIEKTKNSEKRKISEEIEISEKIEISEDIEISEKIEISKNGKRTKMCEHSGARVWPGTIKKA